ncbi:hypothetical protein E2C01_068936 [Portunus trituberculatus]|uniref:Uncharacterized protein n=1 Tax=Portunus trituberculatus TaxID=210409 RepID=A0A5B7HXA0_PORTR|nr:hypothetical protein [Portunus trituberculatus]
MATSYSVFESPGKGTRNPEMSPGSPKVDVPLAFCLCQLGLPEEVYADFHWNDYCFRLCAERITEVILSGMEAYIHYSFLNLNLLILSLTQPLLMLYMIEMLPP